MDDDGRVYLYSGFHTSVPAVASGFRKLRNDGGVVVELEPDMITIRTEPRVIFPKEGPGSFEGHEFFEASSIRKDGDRYIFVYSSRHNHELCYTDINQLSDGYHIASHCGAVNYLNDSSVLLGWGLHVIIDGLGADVPYDTFSDQGFEDLRQGSRPIFSEYDMESGELTFELSATRNPDYESHEWFFSYRTYKTMNQ